MQIQWFPGHMHKARTQIRDNLSQFDLFIEVLDARIPYSSENPMLREIRGEKPGLKILNKSDLADETLTRIWQDHFESTRSLKARAVCSEQPMSIRKLPDLMRRMLPKSKKVISAIIVGIPNVGKSTLINILAGKKIARTGNEPAVTKGQQKVRIGDGIFLYDTPGMLWPNVENPNSGMRLAATGAIKDTAMDYADAGFFAAKYLLKNYPDGLKERFDLEQLPDGTLEFFEVIGRRKGCLRKGGVVDLDRICRIFLHEMRTGKCGPLTMETPEMAAIEELEVEKKREEKEAKDQQRSLSRQGGKKSRRRRR